MSNKQQLQTNNEKYASLIETLRGKAIPSGSEDLDTELTTQENLISQLSTILDSKASGGSSGSEVNIETCTVTFENISWDCGIDFVTAMVAENGIYQIYTAFNFNYADIYTLTIPNVVCGTEINLGSSFDAGAGIEPYIEINGTASFDSWIWGEKLDAHFMLLTFTSPSAPNENCTIGFMGNV